MKWLEIIEATGQICGEGSNPRAAKLPTPKPGRLVVEATDADVETYRAFDHACFTDQRPDRPLYQNGAVVLPDDPRPRFRIAADKATVRADGTDTVILTVTALRADGTVRAAFDQSVVYELPGGRLLGLDFVDGIATKAIKMPQSGRFRLGSTKLAKIETAIDLTAVE